MVGVATCVGHAPEAPTKVVDAGPVTVVDAGLPEQGQSLTLVNQPHAPSRTYASGRGKNGGAPGDLIFLRGDHEAFRIAGDGGFSVEGVPYGRAREGLQAALLAWSTDAVMMQKDGGK